MSVRAQVARNLKGDECDETCQHQCGEGDRAKACSEEGERNEQAHNAKAEANDRRDNPSYCGTLNKTKAAQVHRRAPAKRPPGARVERRRACFLDEEVHARRNGREGGHIGTWT